MRVFEIMRKMVLYSQGNHHDINHFIKVHGYAAMIAECENLQPDQREITEIAAIVHDIACPLCREKYGNTNGKRQEAEGVGLTRDFLRDTGLAPEAAERIVYLVGHHHTPEGIDGMDYQILIEADYLVNAEESHYSAANIRHTMETVFKTETGVTLLKSVYGIA